MGPGDDIDGGTKRTDFDHDNPRTEGRRVTAHSAGELDESFVGVYLSLFVRHPLWSRGWTCVRGRVVKTDVGLRVVPGTW